MATGEGVNILGWDWGYKYNVMRQGGKYIGLRFGATSPMVRELTYVKFCKKYFITLAKNLFRCFNVSTLV